jgi:serpin B
MGRFVAVLLSAGGAMVWLAGCSARTASEPPPPVCSAPQGSASDVQGLASADTSFALAFFPPAAAAAGAGSNVIVSPYSVSATLTMIDVGAAGETDAQLRTTLHLPAAGSALAPAYAALACADETAGDADGQQLSLANALWAQKGKSFEPAFLSALSHGYDAPLQLVDFAGNLSAAQGAVNAWVSQQTQGQIPSLLQSGDVTVMSELVVVNAVYFKGTWDSGFDPSQTAPRPFTLSDGTQVSVPTMSGLVNNVGFGGDTSYGVDLYELPYKGGGLAMDFLLPSKGSLASFEASLTPADLQAVLPVASSFQQSQVQLPKFAFQTRLELATLLAGMGMPDLFDPTKANLSGMDGAMDLSVDTVVQQATVEVNESGTIATAATSADTCNCGGSVSIPMVTIDQPFVFLIRDTSNGNILFMGHVEDPRQGS